MSKHNRAKTKSRMMQTRSTVNTTHVDVGVVIPVHGQADLLKKCLLSLPAAIGKYSYQVILVDNNSPKEDMGSFYSDFINSLSMPIGVINLSVNAGFPKACNLGINATNCDYIALVTTDVELYPKAIEQMINDLIAMPEVGVVGPKLLFPSDTPHGPAGKIQHAGMNFSIHGTIEHTFIGWSGDHPKANKMEYVDAVTGACFVTPKRLFLRAGGFNEAYGMGTWEDIDYCMSVRQLGYNILYEPNAVGTHWVGATAVKYKIPFNLEGNRQLFMSKWMNQIMWTVWKRL